MCCSRRTGWGGEDRSVTSSARRPTGRTVPLTHHHTAPNQACLLSVSVSVSRPPPRRLDFLDSTHPWVFAAHDVDALPPPHDAAVLAHLLHRGPDLHRARARARLHSDFSRSHCLPPPVPPLAALVSPRKTFNFPNRKNFEYESGVCFRGQSKHWGVQRSRWPRNFTWREQDRVFCPPRPTTFVPLRVSGASEETTRSHITHTRGETQRRFHKPS